MINKPEPSEVLRWFILAICLYAFITNTIGLIKSIRQWRREDAEHAKKIAELDAKIERYNKAKEMAKANPTAREILKAAGLCD